MNPYIDAYKKSADDRKVKKRRSFFSTSVLALFSLLCVSFLMVYKHTLGQHLLIEVHSLNLEKKNLITEQSVLLGEKQTVLSRARIISFARERLELDFPSPDRIRWIRVETRKDVSLNHTGR